MVIGLGGPGIETTKQKRKLGICSFVGLVGVYADPNGGDKSKKAFASNLSRNADKTSYSALQHFYDSCEQTPVKEILEDPQHTKLEITHDNAPNYKSKDFLYEATEGLFKKFPTSTDGSVCTFVSVSWKN